MGGVPPPTDEQCEAAVAAYEACGRVLNHAAKMTGIPRNTLRNHLAEAAMRGLLGTKPVLPGFALKSTSTQIGPDGEVQREWVRQGRAAGEEFAPPEGHTVKGVSALLDPQGRVVQQWVKTRRDGDEDIVAAIRSAFEDYRGHATLPPAPVGTDAELATIYNISDHHLGLYAWRAESGADYDLKIGEALLRDAMSELVQRAPPSAMAVILNLGDFIHSDSNENRTRKSGVPLDVDTRYARVLQVGVSLLIHCVQLALQKHASVMVRCLPGNHDPYAALALSVALAAFFDKEERVTIDCDPSPFFWWRFGKVFIGSTHGDMVKPADMPGVMASYRPKDWGETVYRYAYFGHVHHKSVGGGEKAGVVWETFQTLAAKDAWHSASGYSSGRSMVAITHHHERGEVFRHTVSAKLPEAA